MNCETQQICPAEQVLKTLSGKWKSQIFRLATQGPVRFSMLLNVLKNANHQSVSVALKDLEEQGLLYRVVIQKKPPHIEYHLTEKGFNIIPIFEKLEKI